MFTAIGLRIVFYCLCGLIIALTVAIIVRRRLRARRLLQQPLAVVADAASVRQQFSATVDSDASSVDHDDVNLEVPNASEQPPQVDLVPSVVTAQSSKSGKPGDPSQSVGATSWQDRVLFASPAQSDWLGSTAIPKLEPHEVPGADTSDYVFGPMTPTLAAFFPETDDARRTSVRELKQSGDYAPHARENLAATRFVCMFGALLFGGVCVVFAPSALELPLMIGMAVLVSLGWALPALFVKSKAESRRVEIERAIPDMMDVLNMCVSQGLTVPDALHRVARDLKPVYPALAQELAIVVDQAKIGTFHEALQNFAERFDLPQVQSFVSLMTQTGRLGTSVSEALSEYADTMRESLRQRADERANQASFALLFPTVLCLMPAVFLFLMGPAVIELSKFNQAGGLSGLAEGRNAARNLNRQQQRGNPTVRGTNGT
ncbi:MAG: type II secretion system F family protein [Planctomycetaceae bacterium]|nr:type II secretion system F family protein [Planctomycetaceae bacterium]